MEAEALKAMFDHVESLDILPTWFPNIETDNKGNESPKDNHFRVYILPVNTNSTLSVCGSKTRYRWLMQINVHVRDGVGSIKAAEYIDLLRAGTIPNSYLSTSSDKKFRIVGAANLSSPSNSNGWFSYPVTFTIESIYQERYLPADLPSDYGTQTEEEMEKYYPE